MSRVVLALVWLVAAAAVGGVAFIAYTLASERRVPHAMPIERHPAASRNVRNPWARWSVTEQVIAHHVIVATVETRYLEEAQAIARQIAEPINASYAEILIYFHRPGRPDLLAPRRVQWTPKHGYVETVYEP